MSITLEQAKGGAGGMIAKIRIDPRKMDNGIPTWKNGYLWVGSWKEALQVAWSMAKGE